MKGWFQARLSDAFVNANEVYWVYVSCIVAYIIVDHIPLSQKGFFVNAPTNWSSVSHNCKHTELLNKFRSRLKTELFNAANQEQVLPSSLRLMALCKRLDWLVVTSCICYDCWQNKSQKSAAMSVNSSLWHRSDTDAIADRDVNPVATLGR